MAALQFSVNVPKIPLTAATAKTVAQVKAAANQRVKVLGFEFYFDSTSTTPGSAQLRILRQSSAGTSLVAATPQAVEPELTETIQSTCQTGSLTTQTEPTAGAVIRTPAIPITSGLVISLPYGQEIIVGGGGYIGFEVTTPSGTTINVYGSVLCEE